MKSARSHELAAKLRRARARRAELGPAKHGRPGLLPSMRCNRVNVTWLDLVDVDELRDLVDTNKRELLDRRTPGRVTPTDVMALLFYAGFSGLKPGGGAFVQVPIRAMERVLGAGESTVQETHARLERWGYIESFEQSVDVEWVDELGRKHVEAEVWAKRRITHEGFTELKRQGQLERRVVMVGPQGPARVVVVTGALRRLWKACAAIFRVLARRFAGRGEIQTPSCFAGKDEGRTVDGAAARQPRSFFDDATGPPAATAGPAPPSSRDDGPTRLAVARARAVEDLVQRHAVTAALAWPDAWRRAPDARARLYLLEQFERLELEVRGRVFAAVGPGELAELQRQVVESERAAAELGAAAGREAKAAARAKWNAKLDAVERQAKQIERELRRRQ